ncbi:hypothetical protein JTY60_01660 [symbiont of Argiope bruennichi]|uniref:hypothetical protein n=1 Tax=symbiont of Argiope bruennichi TaxID=2810479 RepID=UPI003DA42D29
MNKDDSQIWNILFKNYNNITSNNDFQINIIVQDLLDSSYYLANYTLGADYSNVQLKNIYFLDQSEKMNNLLKNLNFQNKDKTKGPQLNLGELNKYFTNNQIDKIKNHLQNDDIKTNFLSFFNLGKDTNPPKDKTQINSNYNLDFFKNWDFNKHQCQNNGDMYVCSVNNFLKTENWKSDKSFDFFTLYDIDSNGKIILTCKLEINYDNDGNPTFFNVLLDNFYYNNN